MVKFSSLLVILGIFLFATCNAENFQDYAEIILDNFSHSIKNYTFGNRVDGDKLRENRSYHQSHSSTRWHFNVRRPWSGVITQVQLLVEQSELGGNAQIIIGGIGKSSIQIRIDVPEGPIRYQAIVYVKSDSLNNDYDEDDFENIFDDMF